VELPFQSESDCLAISNRNRRAEIIVAPTDAMHEKSNCAVGADELSRKSLGDGSGSSYLNKPRLSAVVHYVNEDVGPVVIVHLENEIIVTRGWVLVRVVTGAGRSHYQSRASDKSPGTHDASPRISFLI
jgi:hypothetical protein